MKKIIYLTSAMEPEDFADLLKSSQKSINPSGQNFHFKLITALHKVANVQVVSARPINPENHPQTTFKSFDNGIFHYVKFKNTKLMRRYSLKKSIKQYLRPLIAANNDLIIIVDCLSVLLTSTAISLKRNYGLKIYGVLTDRPDNLTNVSQTYIQQVSKNLKEIDGLITLTEGLNKWANPQQVPAYVFPGIVRTPTPKNPTLHKKYGDYFFFGGALYERYGVKNMIEAFSLLPTKMKLIIAGDGALKPYIEKREILDDRIIYLGVVNEDQYDELSASAVGAINPRPLDERIDAFSFPSKVLNYFNNAALVFTSEHPLITKYFKGNYISLGEGSTSEIYDALNEYLISKKNYLSIRLKGQRDVQQLCQIDEVAAKLKKFLAL